MRVRVLFVSVVIVLSLARSVCAADSPAAARWSVGTSVWTLANLFPDSPEFYYLEVTRALDDHNALTLEPVTWTYHAPVGIPYGASFGEASENYPGFVRSIGLGLGWRYAIYRGLNASVRSFHFLQVYSEDNRPRKTGYQLFLQARIGWRWASGVPGLFIDPAVAFNWWPIETGRPASFRERDDRWPAHFLLEPWLNAGYQW